MTKREIEERTKELSRDLKFSNEVNFENTNELNDALQKQRLLESQMGKFQKNIAEVLNEKDNEKAQLLKERLERLQEESKKNEAILDSLNKYKDKIKNEELQKTLEKLEKNNSKNNRSLEQLLELTKQFYVEEKANRIAKELEELAKKQITLSDINMDDKFNRSEQKLINDKFKNWIKVLRNSIKIMSN